MSCAPFDAAASAAGSLDLYENDLDYLAQARWHAFEFQLGRVDGLERARRAVKIAPTYDEEENEELIPRREIQYDTLVIAVGSRTNDFGTPGVREHAISLDTPDQAERFHRRLVNACIRANAQPAPMRPDSRGTGVMRLASLRTDAAVRAVLAGRESGRFADRQRP